MTDETGPVYAAPKRIYRDLGVRRRGRSGDRQAIMRDIRFGLIPEVFTVNGDRIYQERLAQLWRQIDLAAKLGVAQTAIWALETGRYYINQHQAELIAEALFGDRSRWRELVIAEAFTPPGLGQNTGRDQADDAAGAAAS